MTPEQKEIFRTALLRVLEERGSDQFGLGVTAIQIFIGQFGFRATKAEEIRIELQYLMDKGLVAPVGKTISPENKSWRITADGRDYLALNP